MSKQLALSFDRNRCTGCMACVVACRDQNDWRSDGAGFRRISTTEKGPYPANLSCRTIACRHCKNAPCLDACPTGALFRHADTGIVDVNLELCDGCRNCAEACPFDAPLFTSDGKMAKCDLCRVRLAHNLLPACVHTCTTGALHFGELEEPSKTKSSRKPLKIMEAPKTPPE